MMANPASINCIEQGGELKIEIRDEGGEFGVCVFKDDKQCEEWALMRGECPNGGVIVSGYMSEAASYCVITGGSYNKVEKGSQKGDGECLFKNGKACDVGEYYQGQCGKQ